MTSKILGIIGDPIQHSLSPAMHNAALRSKKLPYLYLPFHVLPKDLQFFVRNVDLLGIRGFNVTIPHKEKVMRFLDWISPEAKAIGAVNTVLLRHGKLRGYNTDAIGYLRSLQEETKFHPRKKSIFILGAGGASRAIIYSFSKQGCSRIVIANRTLSRARTLAKEFQKKFPQVRFEAISLNSRSFRSYFPTIDLLVNTTSLGMQGTWKNLPLKSLPRQAIVSDLVYRPRLTHLLKDAQKLKLKIHSGVGMLLHQGAESFRIWTGVPPKLAVMRKALIDGLDKS